MPLRDLPEPPSPWLKRLFPLCFALCLAATLLPLWIGRHLPAVDWPQHLFLIHLLDALDDPGFAFREFFVEEPGFTYLVFYYSVHFIARIFPLEIAFKIFLSLLLTGIPLSLLFLLRALKRSRWLCLLSFPMLFTYSFYWGLFSFMATIPWTFLAIGCFVHVLGDEFRTKRWALYCAGAALSLTLLQLTHAAAMVFPALALPAMLLLTPSDRPRRVAAVLSVVPGVALFFIWLVAGQARPPEPGSGPWQAVGSLFESRTYLFDPLAARLSRLPSHLAGGFWSYADRPALFVWLGVIALVIALSIFRPQKPDLPLAPRLRPAALFLLAFACYLFLPMDVKGYMYQIYPRYSQLAALLLIAALPFPFGKAYRIYAVAATALGLYFGINLAVQFHRFDVEAREFDAAISLIPENSRIMHLVVDPRSRVSAHAVYLHYAALAAARTNGVPSFSLARHDPFPVHYRQGAHVPSPRWEWRPQQFDWKSEASWFDVYLVRGASAEKLFGKHLRHVEPVGEAGGWAVYRRRADAAPKNSSR